MKLVSALAAACLAVTGFMMTGTAANAGGLEVRIYERYTSYRHYERVTVLSRHHGYRAKGYRVYRPGYVYHQGQWFSSRSLRAGVIIDRPIPRRQVVHYRGGINPKHHSWCADRYRSYHWRSNTFQPYHGPRQQCYSPFY
ncbi:BA14K family protein [Rhizobium sp. CRIBSB]|nr:BA14K family protein [Rhizobium sp. CRIBSB]